MFSSKDDRKDKMMRNLSEPASHKVIEKRRRDRINNCLLELSQAVPSAFAKQNTSKLEKAEILEMTVDYLRAIQTTELGLRYDKGDWYSPDIWSDFMQHYQCGYSDCMREVARFMTDVEGLNVNDSRCMRLLTYLQTRFRPDSSVSGGLRQTLHRVTSAGNFHSTGAIGQTTQDGVPPLSRNAVGPDRYPARLMPYVSPNCIQFNPPDLPASRSQNSKITSSTNTTKNRLVLSANFLPGENGLEPVIRSSSPSSDVISYDQQTVWPRFEPGCGHGQGPIRHVKYQHRRK